MHFLVLCCVLASLLLAGCLILLAPVRAGSTITVMTTNDVIPSDGHTSLREAIVAANTDSAFSDCRGGSGLDVIDFSTAGVVTCLRAGLSVGPTPSLVIVVSAPSSGGTITNVATQASQAVDPDTEDNAAQASTRVSPGEGRCTSYLPLILR